MELEAVSRKAGWVRELFGGYYEHHNDPFCQAKETKRVTRSNGGSGELAVRC